MFRWLDRFKEDRLFALSLCLAVLAIPLLLPTQPSVAVDALSWAFSVALAGTALGILVPRSAHVYLAAGVFSWLILAVGIAQSGAVLLWLASAWSLGILVLGRLQGTRDLSLISTTEAIVVGATLWLAIWGAMLHFPVNYRALHIVLCALPCIVLARRAAVVREHLCSRACAANDWMRSIPLWAWVAGVAVVGWVLRWTSFPSIAVDDNALHLRMWTELVMQQRYGFDVGMQIWSAAPFVVDVVHSVVSLMAGDDARGAMNLAVATLLLTLMVRIFQLWKLSVRSQWLLALLMASTPMLGNLLMSLQTELGLALVAIAGLRLVIDAEGGWRGRHVMGVLACAALSAGIKLPGAVLGVTLLVALAVQWWMQRGKPASAPTGQPLRWPALLLLIPMGFVALHSYVVAWVVAGNPVFPLYNGIFQSLYYRPENFTDMTWVKGFGISSYVRAFFHTSEFFESGDYVAGWQYLFLLPVALAALLLRGVPIGLRIAVIPLLGFGLAMFSATQYWRYLFPVMPVAGVVMAALFTETGRKYRAPMVGLVMTCIALNLVFFPRVSWVARHTPPSAVFTEEGRKSVISSYLPIINVTEKAGQLAPGARVFYAANVCLGATLRGTPLYACWVSYERLMRYSVLKTMDDMRGFLAQERPDFVVNYMNVGKASESVDALLTDYLSKYGTVVGQDGTMLLYKVSDIPVPYQKVFDLKEAAAKVAGQPQLLLPFSKEGVQVPGEATHVVTVPTHHAGQVRYNVDLQCTTGNETFVLQIYWDKGRPNSRPVACDPKVPVFTEVVSIPLGASSGAVFISAYEKDAIRLRNLSVEVH